jgi:hypothetical protein
MTKSIEFMGKKYKFLIGLCVGMFIFFGAAVAWVTQAADIPAYEMTLIPKLGVVELLIDGSQDWDPVTQDTVVHTGDSVRTLENSEAWINYYDQGISRIDENTHIVIEEMTFDSASLEFIGNVQLETGKIWSKLIDFLSPDSVFETQTANTVATVRGTSYFMQAGNELVDELVYVDSHNVDVTKNDLTTINVEEGKFINWIGTTPIISDVDTLPTEQKEWIDKNTLEDSQFEEFIQQKHFETLESLSFNPDSILGSFIELSEELRLLTAVKEETRIQLEERFTLRKLTSAQVALIQEDTERALLILSETEFDLTNDLSDEGTQIMNIFVQLLSQSDDDANESIIEIITETSGTHAQQLEFVEEKQTAREETSNESQEQEPSSDSIAPEEEPEASEEDETNPEPANEEEPGIIEEISTTPEEETDPNPAKEIDTDEGTKEEPIANEFIGGETPSDDIINPESPQESPSQEPTINPLEPSSLN